MSVVFSEHLPLLTSAPDGIQKLRGLILELAVRGKLVPQDPNDEPASELLKRIAQERVRMDAAATRRKSKETSTERNDSPRFDLPSGWECAPLGEVVEIVRGITFPSSEKSKSPEHGRVLCLRTSNVQDKIEWDDVLYIRSEFISRNDQYLIQNDIVMSMANSRELVGKVALVDAPLSDQVTFGGFLGVLRPISILPKFLMAFLRAPTVRSSLIDSASQTTNIANISLGKLRPLEFPIPPLAEQHRIVAKVEELMALCDQLEAEQADAASAHARLVETLLGALTQSTGAADLAANWQRLAEHIDTLFTTEASIDALKQTVLQLAVNGFLVPLDSNEKPKTGKLGDYVEFLNGYAFKSEWFAPSGVRLLRNANVGHGMCDWRDVVYLSADRLAEFDRFRLHADDLVLSLDRPIINTGLKIARVACKDLPCLLLQRVAKIVTRDGMISLDYLYLWFNSPVFLSVIDPGRSNGVPHISTKQVAGLQFVCYPPEVQQRIVAKVDELMALCDRLKADLATSRQHQARLADTLIELALEAA